MDCRRAELRIDEDECCGDEAENHGVLGHRLALFPGNANRDVPLTSLRAKCPTAMTERVDDRYEGSAIGSLSRCAKVHPKG